MLTSPDLGATVIRQPNVFAMRQHSTSRDRSEPPTLTGRRTLPALPVALPLGGRNAHQKRITCCIPDRLQPSDPLLSSHIALSLVITGSSTMRNQHQILYFFFNRWGKKKQLRSCFLYELSWQFISKMSTKIAQCPTLRANVEQPQVESMTQSARKGDFPPHSRKTAAETTRLVQRVYTKQQLRRHK